MVKIINQRFTSKFSSVSFYTSSFILEGEITVDDAKLGDEIFYQMVGYLFNDGSIVTDKDTKEELARISLVTTSHDPEFSHTSDNPQQTTQSIYKIRFSKDLPDGTTINTRYQGMTSHSMSNKPYTLNFEIREGKDTTTLVLSTPVNIPEKPVEQAHNVVTSVFTGVNYIEGKWDGKKRGVVAFATTTTLPRNSLIEVKLPTDYMSFTDTVTVGKVYTASPNIMSTATARVNSYGVYQKTDQKLEVQVTEVSADRVVLKLLSDSTSNTKYNVDMGDGLWGVNLRRVYEMETPNEGNIARGTYTLPTGGTVGQKDHPVYVYYLVGKKNTGANVPYVEVEEPEPPAPAPEPLPEPEPIEAPSCMECMGCTDCSCKTADVLTTRTYKQLDDKLRVFIDLVCVVMNAHCLDLPRILGKFIYMLWCFLTDLVNQIRCLHSRTDILRKRDEELCAKTTNVVNQLNTRLQVQTDNNNLLLKYISDTAVYVEETEKVDNQLRDYERKATQQEGYLVKPKAQAFVLLNEPQAVIESVAGGQTIPSGHLTSKAVADYPNLTTGVKYSTFSSLGEGVGLIVSDGTTLTVTYSGLRNSSYMGRKITKAVYSYKVVQSTDNNGKTFFFVFKDPTKTVFAGDSVDNATAGGFFFEFTTDYYYEDGSKANLDGENAIVSYASLNKENESTEQVRGVSQGNFIPISGSSITYADGAIKATSVNSGDWDKDGHPREYYGAGAGKYQRTITVGTEVHSNPANYSSLWFAFNTGLKAVALPPAHNIKPPTPPQLKPLPDVNHNCSGLTEFNCGEIK